MHSQTGRLESAVLEELPPRARVAIADGRAGVEAQRCEQCDEPLCLYACKSGALHRVGVDGPLVLDSDQCVACLMCVMVCPSGIRADLPTEQVVRCNVCGDLTVPACVAACPTRALGVEDVPAAHPRTDFAGHVVVVGSSAAGIAACEAARAHAPACSITMVTADDRPGYSRPLLPYALSGTLDEEHLHWRSRDYLETTLGVTLVPGVRASGLDTAGKVLHLSDRRQLGFDRIVLATGARATTVSIPGADLLGVVTLRNFEDLDRLDALARPGGRAIVMGGGNVGLQASEALISRGVHVTVVVRSPYLLSQMVDEEAGRRVGALFTRHGVDVRTGHDVTEIVGNGRVGAARLDSGETLPVDLVVVGKGIRPEVEWLRESGLEVERGVRVDAASRTNVTDVFAAGDCAEAVDPLTGRSSVSGIWPVAYEMGRAAGATAVGVETHSPGALRMNASRFFGETVISIGEVLPERLPGASVCVLAQREDVYRKVVLKDGRLVGALLYGDVSAAGRYYRLYRDGADVSAVRPEELETHV
jgi:NAD(P)H-nitrite reductase large subunit/Fe-S-cluster-containing hydrogenase component 2